MSDQGMPPLHTRPSPDPTGPDDGAPDPMRHPEYYEGLMGRRVGAWLIDQLLIGLLVCLCWSILFFAGIMTLGLLFPLLPLAGLLVPILYQTLLIGRPRAATPGMAVMDLRVHGLAFSTPGPAQALIRAVLFMLSVSVTGFLILLVIPFMRTRRGLHDWLSGTMVLRRVNDIAAPAS